MPPKHRTAVPIAPGTRGQTEAQRAESFTSSQFSRPLLPRVRTSHACDRCRDLRAKCSGDVRCAKCGKDDVTCVYSNRKRERIQQTLAQYAQQVDDLSRDRAALLTALKGITRSESFAADQHPGVLGLVERMYERQIEPSQPGSRRSSYKGSRSSSRSLHATDDIPVAMNGSTTSRRESLVGSNVDSLDRQRELSSSVDLDQGIGLPGYVGKMSDVSWMQRIRVYLVGFPSLCEPGIGILDINIQAITTANIGYYVDDQDLLAVDEDCLDPEQLPNWHAALVLTEAYFQAVQGPFRFVERNPFLDTLRQVFDRKSGGAPLTWPQRHWLALANIMWAVASKWLTVSGFDQPEFPVPEARRILESHLVYYARARSLGLDHRIQLDHPGLELVQGMALLGFYLLTNGSVHRSCTMIAQTIRQAIALGLHLKVSPGVLLEPELIRRARVWWSLFRMETLLSEITGRPKCLKDTDITVPPMFLFYEGGEEVVQVPSISNEPDSPFHSRDLWKAFVADQPEAAQTLTGGVVLWSALASMGQNTSKGHFTAALDLSGISDKIASSLYLSPTDVTWAEVQSTVRVLEADLQHYLGELQEDLTMETITNTQNDPRATLELEMYLCSLRMILYRPFLRKIQIEDESVESAEFNQRSARAGVNAAIRMINILPHNSSIAQVLQTLPWWILLHYISQALSALILELCLSLQHMQGQTYETMTAVRKALGYLSSMSSGSKSAYRAWTTYRSLIEKVAQRYSHDALANLPLQAPVPVNWAVSDQQMLQRLLLKTIQ